MKIEDICLTIEQARELKELGIDFSNSIYEFVETYDEYEDCNEVIICEREYVTLEREILPKNKLVFIIELGRRIENEKDYLRKWKGTKECENAKAWHEILLEDAEQFSRKLKEKELKNNNNHED